MTRSRTTLFAAAVVLLAALFLGHCYVQPRGKARVITSGSRVYVLRGPVGFYPRYLGSSCLVDQDSTGRLLFRQTFDLAAEWGVAVPATIRFAYDPDKLPTLGATQAWCSAVSPLIRAQADQSLRGVTSQEVAADPRASGRTAAVELERRLKQAGIEAFSVTVRLAPGDQFRATLPVPEVMKLTESRPPVIFIGLDGGDWNLLDRFVSGGSMPNLSQLVKEGRGGTLRTQRPPLSPLLWTTMMTGVSPLEHGVLDFVRFNPHSGVREPVTSDMRSVPAVWNMATYGGKRVAVSGLWATYPAEPVAGTVVSDRLFAFLYKESEPPPGVVFPPSREASSREVLRSVEAAIQFEQVKGYLPWLSQDEYSRLSETADPYARPESALRRILVETMVYDRVTRRAIDELKPDLTILYIQGTDSIGHVFAPFAPPRQAHISERDFEKFQHVPELYFRDVDRLLGDYMKIASDQNGVLMLASDHGFLWGEGRPRQLSSNAMGTAGKWHADNGIFLLWGKGISPEPGHRGRGEIQQVAATLLELTGLPSDSRLAGPSLSRTRLVEVGADRSARANLLNLEDLVDYRRFFKPVAPITSSSSAGQSEELAKLQALGYLGAGDTTSRGPSAQGSTRTAGSYNNEGLIHREHGRPENAITSFEKAISIDPNLASALWNLSDLLFARKDLERSDQLMVRAVVNGLPEGVELLIGRAIGYQRNGDTARSLRLMEAAVAGSPPNAELRLFRARYRIEKRDCAGALEDFRKAQELAPSDPNAFAGAGLANLCLGKVREAEQDLRRSLVLNPRQPMIERYLRSIGRGQG